MDQLAHGRAGAAVKWSNPAERGGGGGVRENSRHHRGTLGPKVNSTLGHTSVASN